MIWYLFWLEFHLLGTQRQQLNIIPLSLIINFIYSKYLCSRKSVCQVIHINISIKSNNRWNEYYSSSDNIKLWFNLKYWCWKTEWTTARKLYLLNYYLVFFGNITFIYGKPFLFLLCKIIIIVSAAVVITTVTLTILK